MKSSRRINPNTIRKARKLRSTQSVAEATLWRALRNRNLEYKFRRQHPISPFIIDYYCPQVKLCIEIDGGSHYEPGRADSDLTRTEYLRQRGYQVIRFTNDDILKNIDAAVELIINEIEGLISKQ